MEPLIKKMDNQSHKGQNLKSKNQNKIVVESQLKMIKSQLKVKLNHSVF
jgi:hypothetical protein